MLTMNPHIWPDGGWFFKDAEGTKHRASSFPGLVKLVIEYRQRRRQDVGNPTLEIMTQLCGRNQGFCKDTNGPGPIPESPDGNMMAKMLSFLANADSAGLVLGARVPVILTSRADSVRSRIASCAVAVLAAHARRKSPR